MINKIKQPYNATLLIELTLVNPKITKSKPEPIHYSTYSKLEKDLKVVLEKHLGKDVVHSLQIGSCEGEWGNPTNLL